MKKNLFFSMLAVAGMLFATSCQEEALISEPTVGDYVNATFTIATEDGMGTRAIGDGTSANEVVCAVFDQYGKEMETLRKYLPIEEKKAKYEVRLAKGQDYRVAFFAYNKEAKAYDVTNLKRIVVNDKQLSNIEARDAFTKYVDVKATTNKIEETVILKRPFAQLNLGIDSTELKDAAYAGVEVAKTQVKVSNVYREFSAFDDAVVAGANTMEMTFAMNAIPTESLKVDLNGDGEIEGDEGKFIYLALNYLLVGDAGTEKSLTDVEFIWQNEDSSKTNKPATNFYNVPVQRNYRTNIIGKLLTNPAIFNIVIDEAFENPDYIIYEIDLLARNGGSHTMTESLDLTTRKNPYLQITADAFELNIPDGVSLTSGSAVDYGVIVRNGTTTINGEGDIHSEGGGLGVVGGASLIFNGGNLDIHTTSTSGRYLFYADGEGSTITINGGNFADFTQTSQNQKRAYVYAMAGTTVYINGGTFGKASTRSGYTDGIMGPGTVVIKGGTFGFDPTRWVAEGYSAVKDGNKWVVAEGDIDAIANTADELVGALENGENVLLTGDIEINPANMSNAYGTTGLNVKNGQTIDGGGHTIDISGANGTWDSGINTTGGLIKNLTVTGSFRGIFINHNSTHSEKVVLENVTIDGTTYTISCDQGTNQGLEATDCTFNGWTSYAATLGEATFVDCSFGEGNGYKFMRPYAPTEYVNCDFSEGYTVDPRAAVTFENCTLNGVALTAENLATLVTASNISNATVK